MPEVLVLGAGLALLIGASALLALCLRIRGGAPLAIAVMTIAAAIVVSGSLALSLLGAYRPGPMLLFQLLVLAASVGGWIAAGRPRPGLARPEWSALREAARSNGAVTLMLIAAAVATVVELTVGLAIAPNSWDGLMYHLSRAALWIQNESVLTLDGGTIYQTQHQANGEMLYAWTMLLSDGDRFVAAVQTFAAVGCGLAVYWGARTLEFPRSASAFAGALFLTFPQIVTSATSSFVDIPAALFVGAFTLFCIRAIRDRDRGDLVIAALALGVGVGVKGTFFLALPGLLILIVAAVRVWRPSRRFVVTGVVALGIAAVVLGSSRYVQNVAETGSPQGPAADEVRRTQSVPLALTRTAWTMVDVPGFGGTWIDLALSEVSPRVFSDGQDPGPGFVGEDYVAYGLVGWLVLLPLLLYFAISRNVTPARRYVAWAAILYGVAHAVVVETYSWAPHTLVTGVMIGAPLLAWTARPAWLRHLVTIMAVYVLSVVLIQNDKKQLYPEWTPGLERAEQQGLGSLYGDNLARMEEILPDDARLAYIGPRKGTWDYPAFGADLDRYVYRVEADPEDAPPTAAQVDAWVAERDLDAVIWSGVEPPPGADVEVVGDIASSRTVIELVGDR